jgi:ABC-type polysaccharide/polyol phosphate export permease
MIQAAGSSFFGMIMLLFLGIFSVMMEIGRTCQDFKFTQTACMFLISELSTLANSAQSRSTYQNLTLLTKMQKRHPDHFFRIVWTFFNHILNFLPI